MSLMEDLDPADLDRLLERAERERFGAGEALITEGAHHRGLLVLRSGRVRIERSHLGTPIPLGRPGPGEVFGEVSLLLDAPATASVVAEEDAEADVVGGAAVDELVEGDPAFGARLYRSLAMTLARRLSGSTDDIVSRYGFG